MTRFGCLLARRRGSVSVSLGELLGAAEPESSSAEFPVDSTGSGP